MTVPCSKALRQRGHVEDLLVNFAPCSGSFRAAICLAIHLEHRATASRRMVGTSSIGRPSSLQGDCGASALTSTWTEPLSALSTSSSVSPSLMTITPWAKGARWAAGTKRPVSAPSRLGADGVPARHIEPVTDNLPPNPAAR
jgi:hypothetical protein